MMWTARLFYSCRLKVVKVNYRRIARKSKLRILFRI